MPASSLDDARLAIARLAPERVDFLPRACRLAADALRVERVDVWLLGDDRTTLRRVSSAAGELRAADAPAYFAALERERVIADADRAPGRPGVTSRLDAPIYRGGRVAGVVCHEHVGPPRQWTADERQFAGSVADLIAEKLTAAELAEARAAARALDAQLAEARRMETLGQFAAGLAHDFKNLLTVILGATDLLADRPDLPEDLRPLVAQIADAAQRGSTLAGELTAHARPAAPRVLALADAVEELLPLLRAAAGPRHPVEFARGEGAGSVFLDPTRLERVLMNLVVNARDATPQGGPIRLSVAGAAAPPGAPPGSYARIEVRDEGVGIPPENLERIFEPFFTTKGLVHGSGLGLAIVRQVVDRAGGVVRAASEPGRGATFSVYLPRVTSAVQR